MVSFLFSFFPVTLPEEPVKLASSARDATAVAQALPSSRARTKSLLEDRAFSTTAGLLGPDAEVSLAHATPHPLYLSPEDLDDMDADLFGLKRSNLASDKRAARGPGKEELPRHPKPAGDAIPAKKPPPSPSSFGHQDRKFSFEDLEDPLAGLLSDNEEGITKKPPGAESKMASEKSPAPVRDQGPSIPLTPGDTPVRKKEEVLFDEEDDIVATLGFADSPTAERRQTGDQEGPRPARSRLDELLGRGTATKLLARPGTGEHREFKLDKKYQRPQDKEDPWGDEDFTFGAYQPTVGSCEGRQSRRQSVRFLAEDGTDTKGEPGSKPSTPAASSPIHPRKGGADWLGLKDDDLFPPSPTREAQRGGSALSTPSVLPPRSQPSAPGRHSAPGGLPSSSLGPKPPAEGAGFPAKASQPSQLGASEEKEEEDWLSQALSRKKSQGLAREEHTEASKGQNLVGAVGSAPSSSQPVPSTQGFEQAAAGGPSGTAAKKPPIRPATSGAGRLPQVAQGAHLPLSCHLQVRRLELERAQHELLLESVQQRHQADLELIESAHRSRVKVLETSYQQREERLRREHEELSARYLSHCQEAEQARAELAAQYQRRLAAAMQEKDQEMERLRELQRASILEMRQDHEEQLQRLKVLKDQEIDAVTSATSHTRSLNGIIEQMEKFSSSLHELSSRVEASHLTTTQERELGLRQHDQQLRALQERLGQQRREERSHLQEVIGKMEARLNEQSRLLEQERWRVTAEQSKAESSQRALEEQRKVMVQQISMEREELEKAKSALLEEQKSVMHKCGEERRRLAAEWAEFYAQQKLSKERAEREAERALQMDSQREGTLVSLAKEQAELKIRASELRAKEEQLAAEREAPPRSGRARNPPNLPPSQPCPSLWGWAQEHLSLAQQRLRLGHVPQDLPSSPVALLPMTQGPAAASLSAIVAPAPSTPQRGQPPTGLGASHLHARLVLLKHTAEQDRDFLENEQFFLETLKKASYNMTSHST
uniref:Fas binding factor 1 n=1 Tax=Ursus maritimus TaxID=29073 RepID=A0A452U1Q0_URSMA